MARRRSGINLSAPTVVVFVIAVALMAFGILGYYTDIINIDTDLAFLTLTGGGILLTLGNLLKNL